MNEAIRPVKRESPRWRARLALRLPVCLLVSSFGALALLLSATRPAAQEIVKLSIASTQADWKATPEFSYTEQDDDVRSGVTVSKTYRVWMLDGSPYSRLTAIGNEPLSRARNAQESLKLRKEIVRRAEESAHAHAARVAKYQKDRHRMFALIDEMAAAFDFKFLGEQKLEGHDVDVFTASPRPGYQPKSWETRILTGMKGKLWVDRDTYQWVKVEAVAIRPVRLGWFIAKVLPGTRFLLEQAPVTGNLWQPEHFSIEARAWILGWRKDYVHSETYTDYRRLTGSTLSRLEGRPHP